MRTSLETGVLTDHSLQSLHGTILMVYIGPGWLNEVGNWTTKTGRHDIAESGVKHQKINQSIYIYIYI